MRSPDTRIFHQQSLPGSATVETGATKTHQPAPRKRGRVVPYVLAGLLVASCSSEASEGSISSKSGAAARPNTSASLEVNTVKEDYGKAAEAIRVADSASSQEAVDAAIASITNPLIRIEAGRATELIAASTLIGEAGNTTGVGGFQKVEADIDRKTHYGDIILMAEKAVDAIQAVEAGGAANSGQKDEAKALANLIEDSGLKKRAQELIDSEKQEDILFGDQTKTNEWYGLEAKNTNSWVKLKEDANTFASDVTKKTDNAVNIIQVKSREDDPKITVFEEQERIKANEAAQKTANQLGQKIVDLQKSGKLDGFIDPPLDSGEASVSVNILNTSPLTKSVQKGRYGEYNIRLEAPLVNGKIDVDKVQEIDIYLQVNKEGESPVTKKESAVLVYDYHLEKTVDEDGNVTWELIASVDGNANGLHDDINDIHVFSSNPRRGSGEQQLTPDIDASHAQQASVVITDAANRKPLEKMDLPAVA